MMKYVLEADGHETEDDEPAKWVVEETFSSLAEACEYLALRSRTESAGDRDMTMEELLVLFIAYPDTHLPEYYNTGMSGGDRVDLYCHWRIRESLV